LRKRKRAIKMSLTEKQLEERKNYIGGSDAATICGVNPYGNIIELWQEKLGLKEIEDISDNPAIKAGNYLEPVVAQWFSDETKKKVILAPDTFYHKSLPWMAANVDRLIEGEKAALECKTASRDTGWGSDGDNTIPDYYLCQVAHYACVLDLERVYIGVLIGANDMRHHYVYERNQKLEDMIIAKEKAFWECVKTETPPEPRSMDEVISLYSQATDEETLIITHEVELALDVLRHSKSRVKELEEIIESSEKIIKSYMKNHSILYDVNGKLAATWKNAKGAQRFDAKRFAKEHKDLYEKYLKTGEPIRRFLLK
jgi:putative phage-type endonuclease